jgi:hypothetical protein
MSADFDGDPCDCPTDFCYEHVTERSDPVTVEGRPADGGFMPGEPVHPRTIESISKRLFAFPGIKRPGRIERDDHTRDVETLLYEIDRLRTARDTAEADAAAWKARHAKLREVLDEHFATQLPVREIVDSVRLRQRTEAAEADADQFYAAWLKGEDIVAAAQRHRAAVAARGDR